MFYRPSILSDIADDAAARLAEIASEYVPEDHRATFLAEARGVVTDALKAHAERLENMYRKLHPLENGVGR